MEPAALRVVADDLTGACDIGAALLPWPGGVVVEAYETGTPPPPHGLRIPNTQSRTLDGTAARAAVRKALGAGTVPREGIVLKKIDTALRGHLGAEVDETIDAVGAAEAFVMPAIPAIARTTVGGIQRIGGVPVHETAFADDPLHPIRESAVATHLARGTGRRACVLSLDDIRSGAALGRAIERGRASGCTLFVCDAETDADLDRALDVLLERPRPLVVAGSLGLGRAVRRRYASDPAMPPAVGPAAATGALVVVGSAHPMARAQSEAVAGTYAVHEIAASAGAAAVAARMAESLAAGRTAVLRTPSAHAADAAHTLLAAIGDAVAACVAAVRPSALLVVGGETAHAVLTALGQPWIRVIEPLDSLVVGGALVEGRLDGVPLVTKGGSSGSADTLCRALAWARGTPAG